MQIPWPGSGEEWRGVSRWALTAWLVFYASFLLYAAANRSRFLFFDYVNLVIHEGGHFFFGWFGETLGLLGGTLGELLVPALLAGYFLQRKETAGFAFTAFWFFENFLYIGTYMADARRLSLPLVGSGEHDWEILFSRWGVLVHDQTIGGIMHAAGWIGMLAAVGWLLWISHRFRTPAPR